MEGDGNRVASLQSGKILERGNTLTYPGKSGTFALTDDLTTYTIDTEAGNTITLTGSDGTSLTKTINNIEHATSADSATNDKDGNDISLTYAKSEDVQLSINNINNELSIINTSLSNKLDKDLSTLPSINLKSLVAEEADTAKFYVHKNGEAYSVDLGKIGFSRVVDNEKFASDGDLIIDMI